ncbi:putative target of rapamycin (TOR) kinase 1 [Trypanosoma cruzi]|uniref:Putative target of rapamycin (TOR) kinase 1 n=1 Tax=Trypanosoma cruzi TaxID=5693 RepID=A0A2V2UZI6_TRYCR|nr:putative target of rapamycin (TOR) kinase 1 [Trypanosoma cruzi]
MEEDRKSGATQYTFLWVQFDHTHRVVSLSDKFVRSVRAMPALNSLTIAAMEVMALAFCTRLPFFARVYANNTFLSRQCDDDYRQLTGDCAGDVPGEPSTRSGWFGRETTTHHREYNRRRMFKLREKASAAIITDASLHGWGAVFIPDSSNVKTAGGKWRRSSFLIMQAEVRAVLLALSAFPAALPPTMDVWVDNTSLQGAAIKAAHNRTPWRGTSTDI